MMLIIMTGGISSARKLALKFCKTIRKDLKVMADYIALT